MPRVVPSQVVNLIDQLFPQAKAQEDTKHTKFLLVSGNQNELAAIIELFEQIPAELINLDAKNYTELVLAISAVRNSISIWKSKNVPLDRIQGYRSNLNPITLIRRSLTFCPDEAIESSTVELAFISDDELRQNLRKDISAANQALNNGEWKAATVLAGATIEALLLWALQDRSKSDVLTNKNTLLSNKIIDRDPGNDLNDWSLHPLIEVSHNLDEIEKTTTDEARLAKNFRNLIHPGRSARLGQTCDRGTALATVGALEHVIRDLTQKHNR